MLLADGICSQDEGCFTPGWRDSRGENNREALPGRPPDAPGKLPLGDDELLSKKRVLGDQFDATANEIRGQSCCKRHPLRPPNRLTGRALRRNQTWNRSQRNRTWKIGS